jgi:hypothetical protein
VRFDQLQAQRQRCTAARGGHGAHLLVTWRSGGKLIVCDIYQHQQLAHPVDALAEPHQQIGERDTGAKMQRIFADFADNRFALLQHHQQMLAIFGRQRIATQKAGIAAKVALHLKILHQKR